MTDKSIANDLFGIPVRAKTVNSKKKGNRGELIAAKLLAKWTGYEFNRVPNSGGLGWRNSHKVVGDIVPEDGSDFPFTVEVKNYDKLLIEDKLRSNSLIFTFWKQALRDASKINKKPLLMVRYNGMAKDEFYVFMPNDIAYKFPEIKLEAYGYYQSSGQSWGIQGYLFSNLMAMSYKDFKARLD